MIEVKVDKAEEKRLMRKLNSLPEKVFKKSVTKATNYAMTPVLKAARGKVPVSSGKLKKSLAKKRKVYSRAHVVWQGVGVKRGMAPHAWIVEHGHRVVSADGVLGFVPPRPFLRPAFNENQQNVLQRYRDKLKQGVLQEVKTS